MATLAEIREKYPQYDDMSDEQLARALHAKHYSDLPFEDFSQRIGLSAPQPQATPEQVAVAAQSPSFAAQLVSAAVRPVVRGATSLPLMAMDAGVAARNLVSNLAHGEFPTLADFNPFAKSGGTQQQYELPSQTFNRTLDEYTLPPEGIAGKGAELVSSVLTGSRVPAPQAAATVPANFVRPTAPLTPQQETFKAGRELGYVAPPSTVKPSILNQLVESLGGKAATQQVMSQANQRVTNAIAARSLGLPERTQITPKVLQMLRTEAGKVYDEVAKSGEIVPDAQYVDDLAQVMKVPSQIAKDFPDANVGASGQVDDLVNSLLRDKFSANSAMAYLRELRKQASANLNAARIAGGDPAKQALGQAQRDAAGALEDMVMRHLSAQGKADLARQFDQARTLIAKTHSVEGALNPATGNVVAGQLATQLKKGRPLSGELRKAADFARAFPKAVEEVKHSGPVSALDALIGASGFAISSPWTLAWPALRIATRHGMRTPSVQDALLPRQPFGGVSPNVLMGGVPVLAPGQ